jgi:hypothetical protein
MIIRADSPRIAREQLTELVAHAENGNQVPVVYKKSVALVAIVGQSILPFTAESVAEATLQLDESIMLNEHDEPTEGWLKLYDVTFAEVDRMHYPKLLEEFRVFARDGALLEMQTRTVTFSKINGRHLPRILEVFEELLKVSDSVLIRIR